MNRGKKTYDQITQLRGAMSASGQEWHLCQRLWTDIVYGMSDCLCPRYYLHCKKKFGIF